MCDFWRPNLIIFYLECHYYSKLFPLITWFMQLWRMPSHQSCVGHKLATIACFIQWISQGCPHITPVCSCACYNHLFYATICQSMCLSHCCACHNYLFFASICQSMCLHHFCSCHNYLFYARDFTEAHNCLCYDFLSCVVGDLPKHVLTLLVCAHWSWDELFLFEEE